MVATGRPAQAEWCPLWKKDWDRDLTFFRADVFERNGCDAIVF